MKKIKHGKEQINKPYIISRHMQVVNTCQQKRHSKRKCVLSVYMVRNAGKNLCRGQDLKTKSERPLRRLNVLTPANSF